MTDTHSPSRHVAGEHTSDWQTGPTVDRDQEADTEHGHGDDESVREALRARRRAFADWRETRPLLGGLLLLASGVAIGWIPGTLVGDVLFLAAGLPVVVGLVNAGLVAYLGVLALVRPAYAKPIGAAGLVLSTLSVFTTLGGMGLGLVTGGAGGILCFAWDEPDQSRDSPVEAGSASGTRDPRENEGQ